MNQLITIETEINKPIDLVWTHFTKEEHITKWNFASPDWHSPRAKTNLKVGGVFTIRMEAKDGSFGFDFSGKYTEIIPYQKLAFVIEDGRSVVNLFESSGNRTRIIQQFEAENENPAEMQRDGWFAILTNFKNYCESTL